MTESIKFALNQMTAPRLEIRDFITLAATLGCVGVELRNDLANKQLSDRAFFDGSSPAVIGETVRNKELQLLGLSEVYGFNHWSGQMQDQVATLITQAVQSGAESISLIPSNSGTHGSDEERLSNLKTALSAILPMLEEAELVAFVEPLGFSTSSLRKKSEAVAAIQAIGGIGRFKLVHDTFHHYLASETHYFPEHTGIVHISGVIDPTPALEDMRDHHRILVDEQDRLNNLEQIVTLIGLGYTGNFSFEVFSPTVHETADPENDISTSMNYIRNQIAKMNIGACRTTLASQVST